MKKLFLILIMLAIIAGLFWIYSTCNITIVFFAITYVVSWAIFVLIATALLPSHKRITLSEQ